MPNSSFSETSSLSNVSLTIVDTSSDWSHDLESFEDHLPRLLAIPLTPRTIEPIGIPLSPPMPLQSESNYRSDDTPVGTSSEIDSSPSADPVPITESQQLSSLVISVRDLDHEEEQEQASTWEPIIEVDATSPANSSFATPASPPEVKQCFVPDQAGNKENIPPNIPFHNSIRNEAAPYSPTAESTQTAARRASAFVREHTRRHAADSSNVHHSKCRKAANQPHRESHHREDSFHRRDSFCSLPTLQDLHLREDAGQPSGGIKETSRRHNEHTKKHNGLLSYRRHKVLNATTGFR